MKSDRNARYESRCYVMMLRLSTNDPTYPEKWTCLKIDACSIQSGYCLDLIMWPEIEDATLAVEQCTTTIFLAIVISTGSLELHAQAPLDPPLELCADLGQPLLPRPDL